MVSFLFGENLPVVNFPYYYLVGFIIGLSCFIIVWVFVVMVYQVGCHLVVSPSESENNPVELIWTFLPSVVVLFLSMLNVGCFNPEMDDSGYVMLKVVGRQWYWSYGSSEIGGVLYDSVMGDFIDSVDKPIRLKEGVCYNLCVTSADVIHSFSVPFLSVKVDAVPGRVNQFSFVTDYCGRHVGYCTELCGAGHAYMPIVVEVVPNDGLFF